MFYIREPSDFGLHTTSAGGVINAAAAKQPNSSGGSRELSGLEQVGTDAPTLCWQAINAPRAEHAGSLVSENPHKRQPGFRKPYRRKLGFREHSLSEFHCIETAQLPRRGLLGSPSPGRVTSE